MNRPSLIQFVHGRCAPSQVVQLPADAFPPDEQIDYSEEVVTTQFLWPTSEGFLPGLIIDRPPGFTLMRSSGETEDMWTQLLLQVGWDLMMSIDQPCRHVTTTTVELSASGQGRVVFDDPLHAGNRLVLVDRLPDLTREWAQAAAATGCVRILAGTICTETGHTVTETEILAAVHAGNVVGALVPIEPPA